MSSRKHEGRWLGVAILILVAAVFYQSYVGRLDLRDSNIAGCERAKLDRSANVDAWTAARKARRELSNDPTASRSQREDAAAAAITYTQTIDSLRSRLDRPFNCRVAFPAPSPIPAPPF